MAWNSNLGWWGALFSKFHLGGGEGERDESILRSGSSNFCMLYFFPPGTLNGLLPSCFSLVQKETPITNRGNVY